MSSSLLFYNIVLVIADTEMKDGANITFPIFSGSPKQSK